MTLISVVIPCYNHGAYVDEAVESVLAQNYPHLEIVIINDGSTDAETNELLAHYERPRSRVYRIENRGLPAARNYGIRQTTGEYVCCLDADDKYHPEYLQKAAAVLDNDREFRYGAVPAWVRFFGEKDALWKTLGSNCKDFSPHLQAVRNNFQSATMFRRKCWQEIGGYDENMTDGYEDWDFWLKLLGRGYQMYCLEEPLIYYRQKAQSMVTTADLKRSRLIEAIVGNNREVYIEYLPQIIVELDEEIQRLKQSDSGIEPERLARKVKAKNPSSPAIVTLRRIFEKLFLK